MTKMTKILKIVILLIVKYKILTKL